MRSFCEKLLQPMLLDHRWIPPRRRLIPWLRNRTDTSLTSSVADLLLSRLCLDDGYGGTISTGKTKKVSPALEWRCVTAGRVNTKHKVPPLGRSSHSAMISSGRHDRFGMFRRLRFETAKHAGWNCPTQAKTWLELATCARLELITRVTCFSTSAQPILVKLGCQI